MTAKAKKLQAFFKENDFLVHMDDNGKSAEVEKWTNGGVDMIFNLNPFTAEEFKQRVADFDIDEEIDLHREDARYKAVFTITQSVADFTAFHNHLKEVAAKL